MHHRAANLGTETAFSVLARAAALADQGRDVINLGIGQPDFPTPEHIVRLASRLCVMASMVTRRPKVSLPCVRRWQKASTKAIRLRSIPIMCKYCLVGKL